MLKTQEIMEIYNDLCHYDYDRSMISSLEK